MDNGIKQARGTGRERVYSFIKDFIKENCYSPSVREICVGVGLSSTASVYEHLEMLKIMGKIDMTENTPRSIRLVGYEYMKVRK